MKSMFFTCFGSKESISSLPAGTPFSRSCTSPLFIKAVTVCIVSSTWMCGRATLPSRLYPSAAAFRCASEGTTSCPSTLRITFAASTVTSFNVTCPACCPASPSFCAGTGRDRRAKIAIHTTFLIIFRIFIFCVQR